MELAGYVGWRNNYRKGSFILVYFWTEISALFPLLVYAVFKTLWFKIFREFHVYLLFGFGFNNFNLYFFYCLGRFNVSAFFDSFFLCKDTFDDTDCLLKIIEESYIS